MYDTCRPLFPAHPLGWCRSAAMTRWVAGVAGIVTKSGFFDIYILYYIMIVTIIIILFYYFSVVIVLRLHHMAVL